MLDLTRGVPYEKHAVVGAKVQPTEFPIPHQKDLRFDLLDGIGYHL
jgi:hypothetical protein